MEIHLVIHFLFQIFNDPWTLPNDPWALPGNDVLDPPISFGST